MIRRLRTNLFVRSLEDRITPATFTVLNLNDSGADSLRDCISKANKAAGADVVAFSGGLTNGTIVLTTGEIAITDSLSISGLGASKLTISGNNNSRIFNTSAAATLKSIDIFDLKLTAAKSAGQGGAILCGDENLSLTRCVLTGNTATTLGGGAVAMVYGRSFNATDCSFTSNTAGGFGGALNLFGSSQSVSLSRCTISGNKAGTAGGVYVSGVGGILDCTISGNTATAGGGGLRVSNYYFPNATFGITNSTISNNVATGGAGVLLTNFNKAFGVQNSTITANSASTGSGGGISHSSGTGYISIASSIVSGNNATKAPDISSSNVVLQKNSAVGSGSGFTKTDQGGNLPFQAHANLKLGALANNGGTTLTHLPGAGSPLIDAGSLSNTITTDQRGTGFPRVIGSQIDIGSTEVVSLLVTNTNNSGAGSLRQVVQHANANPGADTVSFDTVAFAAPQTIKLTTGEMAINEALTILGPAARVTIDGNKAGRIFNLTSAPVGAAIELQNLTLTNAVAVGVVNGGAINMGAQSLTVLNSAITNCASGGGGAISLSAIGGNLLIEDSTLTGNSANASVSSGGAIFSFNNGSVTIRRSTVSNNVATGEGGAIRFNSGGSLTIEESTLAGNMLGFKTGAQGGAILFASIASKFLISNSTLSGNSSDIGGAVCLSGFSGTAIFQNCTITGNQGATSGGGIARNFGTGTVSLDSTIVAGNASSDRPDLSFDAGTNVSGNNNLIGVADVGNFTLTGTGNQTGTQAKPLDAKLGALANNGGPTLTHLLLSGSPAFDKGANPAALATDQRGIARVAGAAADIGAVELTPTVYLVDQPIDENDGNFGLGDLSLREALALANANSDTMDTITFDDDPFNNDPFDFVNEIKLTLGQLAVSGSVVIDWKLPFPLTINANSASRVMTTDAAPAGSVIAINGLRLTGGKVSGSGGAILVGDENVTLTNCIITGNRATTSFGGGVAMLNSGKLTLTDCVVTNNSASSSGGGIIEIAAAGASVTLLRCDISGNTSFQGGGVYARNTFLMESCTVSNNRTTGDIGGGLSLGQQSGVGTAIIRNSTISGNSAANFGGGIGLQYSFMDTLALQSCTLVNNTAAIQGGGIMRVGNKSTIDITSSIVSNNSAPSKPDIRSDGPVNVNFSAIGNTSGFSLTGSNNLPIGADLKLGSLQFNGGPTPTHALLAGSPAVDKGSNPGARITDQRGAVYKRVVGAAPDIGAYETAKVFLVTNINDDGAGSLRQAAFSADQKSDTAGLVRFDPTVFASSQTITLTTGAISLFYNVEIQGPGSDIVTISGNGKSSMFFVGGTFTPGEAIFSGLTLTAGKGSHGGAISGTGQSVIIRDSILSGNSATVGGGAISLNTSRLRMERSTVANNTATKYGGGLYFFSRSSFQISECTISGNSVTSGEGGGLYFFNATYAPALLSNCTISGNSASAAGGGIALNFRGNLVAQNSTITNNTSSAAGGGIGRFGGQGDVTLQSTIVAQNTGTGGPDVNFQIALGSVFANNSIIGVANAGNLTIVGSNNKTGTLATPLDAKLGPLANNGGPTLTHKPLSGSAAIDAGNNNAGLINDQRGSGFGRVVGPAADIGAFELQPPPLITVAATQVNDGSLQRSRVTSLQVTFNTQVTFAGVAASAFTLRRNGGGAVGGFTTLTNVVGGATIVTLMAFVGAETQAGSLTDGRYTLTVLASQINGEDGQLDGDGNGIGGDDFVLVGDPAMEPKLFRLFGDSDGNNIIDLLDFAAFRAAFNPNYNSIFDFDGLGSVDLGDFSQFRARFGASI